MNMIAYIIGQTIGYTLQAALIIFAVRCARRTWKRKRLNCG